MTLIFRLRLVTFRIFVSKYLNLRPGCNKLPPGDKILPPGRDFLSPGGKFENLLLQIY